MLSRELKNLSHWFGEVMEGRAEFTAEGARAFRNALDRAAWNAQAIEEAAADALATARGGPVRYDDRIGEFVAAPAPKVVPLHPRNVPLQFPIDRGDAV